MRSQSTECFYQNTVDAGQKDPQNQLNINPHNLYFAKCPPAKEEKLNSEAPSEIKFTSENNVVKNDAYAHSMAIEPRHSNTYSSNEGMNNNTELYIFSTTSYFNSIQYISKDLSKDKLFFFS